MDKQKQSRKPAQPKKADPAEKKSKTAPTKSAAADGKTPKSSAPAKEEKPEKKAAATPKLELTEKKVAPLQSKAGKKAEPTVQQKNDKQMMPPPAKVPEKKGAAQKGQVQKSGQKGKATPAQKSNSAAPAPRKSFTAEEVIKLNREDDVADSDSDSNFDFLDDEASGSQDGTRSTDLSSSGTEEGKKLAMALDNVTLQTLKEKIETKRKDVSQIKASDPRGVIYLGHLPFGFFEEQMKAFFSQFGVVTRIRLSRNKRTGKSKHYAFVEFMDPFVAQIVADTMDGYFMLHRVLKCKVVPPEKVHPKMFRGSRKGFHPKPYREMQKASVNKALSAEDVAVKAQKMVKKEEETKQKLKEAGIDYEFPSVMTTRGSKRAAEAANEAAPPAKKKKTTK